MSRKWYRVGEVAERAGITVRTLHHYDEIGLLSPGTHTASGHRLYGVRELERLELILLYRQMGFPLPNIQQAIESGEPDLCKLLRGQLKVLAERIAEEQQQLQRLSAIASRLEAGDILSAGDLMDALEATAMFDRYYTPEHMEELGKRRAAMPTEVMEQVQRDWRKLFARFDDARRAGTAATDPSLRSLVTEASHLLAAFTGGNTDIATALDRMTRENTERMFEMWGVSAELGDYYLAAMKTHA